ncbi:SDR family oxidoreductase [Dokdonia sp. Hel_I_53]|uniref:SDR family oxidoreductase n=1 Tax=Dokdonia sp. Hel_I_53 TaxID=1566287 RepID=UPI0011994A6B|nr:SDR family oxidoreductase [Dokdonia sp. Hel_I_53]TVZ51287.1 uncharacterized protein YbjT (DUF2867 family) [Dokdonia sp. Hel_I_53]
MEKIVVAGATGTTGNKIIDLLNESQYFEPIAMVRKESQKEQFESRGIKTVMADLEGDVSHSVNGADKVIFAAGSGGKKVKEVDEQGAIKLVDASQNSNIHKFVMLSSLGADAPGEADDLEEYLWAKHNADEHLKGSKLNYTIVRPGSLTNDKGNQKIKLSSSLKEQGEISRDDVAQTLVRSLNDDVANKSTFEIIKGDTLIGDALDKVQVENSVI